MTAVATTEAKEIAQSVTPWEAKINPSTRTFDYAHLCTTFGLQLIDEALLKRWETVTQQPVHPWLKRGIFFAHQGLSDVLDAVEAKRPVYVYTGRGPSNTMHLGHTVSFLFAKYLQDVLKCHVVIQLSDEEKFYFKPELTREEIEGFVHENTKDIMAFGFDSNRTFVFSQFQYGGTAAFRRLSSELMRHVNVTQMNKIYGFNETSSIGQVYWPIQQIVPAYADAFGQLLSCSNDTKDDAKKKASKPLCIVPMGVDQAVYFRCARDYAALVDHPKPVLICAKFMPGLLGVDKMSSTGTDPKKTLFLDTDIKLVPNLIKKHAFSGGRTKLEEHRRLGGNTAIDVACQLLTFFESDDAQWQASLDGFQKGTLTSGDVKKLAADCIVRFLTKHQTKRKQILV